MVAALPWLIVLLADVVVLLASNLGYSAWYDRALNAGAWVGSVQPLGYSWADGPWLFVGAVCSLAVLLIIHSAVAERAARGARAEQTADRLLAAAGPALAAGPLAGLLAAIAQAAPAGVSTAAVEYQGAELRHNAAVSMADGAFWGGLAGASAAWALLAGAWITRLARDRDSGSADLATASEPDEAADPEEAADPDAELADLLRIMRRVLAIGLAGLAVAVLLLAVLGGPARPTGGGDLQYILNAVRWGTPDPIPAGRFTLANYLPLATVPAYLLALLITLPIAGLAMGPATTLIERVSRGWLAVAAAVLCQAAVAGVLLGTIEVAVRAPQLGGSWLRGYATVLSQCMSQLPNAAGYIALVGWIPAAAMAGVAWLIDRRSGVPAT
jgi:hypothetical protein